MNKILRKENLRPLIVLVAICVAVAVLVAAVNLIAAPIIRSREEEKANAALLVVLPGGKDFEKLELNENYPTGVNSAYKADIGFVFEIKTQGKEAMTVMCGVDNEGKLVKLDVISESETPGYKELVFPYVTGDEGVYNGASSDELELELFTGATLTSNGVYNAVKAALDAYTVANGGALEGNGPDASLLRAESEILTKATALIEGATGFTKVEIDGQRETLASVYKENSGKGYVAYVVVVSSYYGTVESEALIHIGTDGKVKAIDRLTWKTSDAWGDFVPPASDAVDAFYDRIPGTDSTTADSVELITGATNTSGGVMNSVKEALAAVDKIIAAEMPTPEDEILSLAATLVGSTDGFDNVTPEGTTYVKRVFRDRGGRGFVAYVVVISSYYGTVESEAVIYVGNDGKIKNIEKLTWKTSEEGWGFVPPADDVVDAFYDRIPGNNSATVDDVALITGATNTSGGVMNSVKEALSVIDALILKEMPTPESEVLRISATVVGTTAGFDSIPVNDKSYVRRVFRDKGGNGYVAYVVVISSYYGTVESEALIHIGNDGNIKDIEKLTWKTSEEGWGFVPPADDVVDAFYDRIPGNNSATVDDVELISGATNTSGGVMNSVKEALSTVEEIIKVENEKNPTPRIIGVAMTAVMVAVTAGAIFMLKRRRGERK